MLYSSQLIFFLLCYLLGMSDPSKGIYGCGPHSDFGMMTLLGTDSVMGLQVLRDFHHSHITFDVTRFGYKNLSYGRYARIET